MKKLEKQLSVKHDEKIKDEYVASFKKAKFDKSNKKYSERLLYDYSIQLNKLDKK